MGVGECVKNRFEQVPYVALTPVFSGACVGITVFGALATAASVATAGKISAINRFADRWPHASRGVIEIPFTAIIGLLNPSYDPMKLDFNRHNGLLTSGVTNPIFDNAKLLAAQPKPLTRHIASRFTFLGGIVSAVVTRIGDLALGVILGAASIAFLGRNSFLNDVARIHLQSTGLIADIFMGLRGIINPQQFLPQASLGHLLKVV